MNKKKTVNELVDGIGYHNTIIQWVRHSLGMSGNYKEIVDDAYGAITFFKHDKANGIMMNFYPLFSQVIDKHFHNDNNIRLKYLNLINDDRPFEDIHYVKHFKETYKLYDKHFILRLDDDDLGIDHTKQKIDGIDWGQYTEHEKFNVNSLDLLFFRPKSSMFTLLPLPILCSPCILVYLPIGHDLKIDKFFPFVSDSISNYVFNRLMKELNTDLVISAIETRDDFIQKFIAEFSDVLLPIAYELKGERVKFVEWYKDYDTTDAAAFELELDGELIKLFLPSFVWKPDKLIHELPYYKAKEEQFRNTIQNIFGLMYSNWKTINSQKSLLQKKIIPLITQIEVNLPAFTRRFEMEMQQYNQEIINLRQFVTKFEPDSNVELDYELREITSEDGKSYWKFRYAGKTLVP